MGYEDAVFELCKFKVNNFNVLEFVRFPFLKITFIKFLLHSGKQCHDFKKNG
jgi:hypothetical protein